MPTTPSPAPIQASAIAPVTIAAEASTMAICTAADASFVLVVGRHRAVALLLGVLGARHELVAPLAGLRLGLVALRGLAPGFDLLLGFFVWST